MLPKASPSIRTELLPVHETFQNTLQGEGFWSGSPCDFIRLSGCPVGCHFCDTGYSDGGAGLPREYKTIDQLLAELKSDRVVISGGEPFVHKRMPHLVDHLLRSGRMVAIETSGSFWLDLPDEAWITLSPKEHLNPAYPVVKDFWKRSNEVKIVVTHGDEFQFYRDRLIGTENVYLQPEWFTLERTKPLAIDLVIKHGLKLSMQSHKVWGVA